MSAPAPITPTLPTLIITHPTPLPAVPRKSSSRRSSHCHSRSSSFSSSSSSATSASAILSAILTDTSLENDQVLLPPCSTPRRRSSSRSRKTHGNSKIRGHLGFQIGLVIVAALLLVSSTLCSTNWRMDRVLIASNGIIGYDHHLGGGGGQSFLDLAGLGRDNSGTGDKPSQAVQAAGDAKLGAMSVGAWNAYVKNRETHTDYAGPAATLEAWDFH